MSESHVEDQHHTVGLLFRQPRFCGGDPSPPFALQGEASASGLGMGQALATAQETFQGKFQGKEWREEQVRKISDKVFDRLREETGKDHLSFEDVYIAILSVYNDINKRLPGPHNDPPSKANVKAMIEEYDLNLDGLLDREEFAEFIRKMTGDALTAVGQNLVIALVVAPAVALFAKRATEGVPGVGAVVQKIPNSIYASAVALAAVLIQNSASAPQ